MTGVMESLLILAFSWVNIHVEYFDELTRKRKYLDVFSGSYPVGQIFLFNGMPFLHISAVTMNRISPSDLE